MRCDVCTTKIPLGTNECPNCGMKVKDKSEVTFSMSDEKHEHIKVNNRKDIRKEPVKHTAISNKINNIVKIIAFIYMFFVFGLVFGSIFFSIFI